MATFAKFVSDYLHIKEQMAADLGVSISIIERWAAGTANPHPLIKSAVWQYLCDHQMAEDNLFHLRTTIISKVEDVIRKHDPQGLIKMGAPPDEYSSEAKDATHHLSMSRSLEQFQKALWAVFICSFSAKFAGNLEDYESMAKEIWPIKEEEEDGKRKSKGC
ncbi:MAG TPA: hypothetical protein VM577_11500 [Anaerovoracaceae bacterium]|nr:hypothetical protein [Anaerovoracaceae bacterium]